MSNEITLSGVSATIEATQRGYMVRVHDGAGRTVGEKYFPVDCKRRGNWGDVRRLSEATDAAYAAAAAYADSINSRG